MTLDQQLVARLEKVKALPSPPRVAMRILEAARNPDVRLAEVADVVTSDPVITAKIMRTANSAAYARRGSCTTLRQALMMLGLDATLIIALSFSLVMNLRRDRLGGLDHEWYWRRSLLAATAARALGRALGRHDCEALFLSALLQDIGMLALDRLDQETYAGADGRQRDHDGVSALEVARLGHDHAAVGAWLMQRWQLPQPVVDAIAASHDPLGANHDDFARCVGLSGPLADVWLASDWSCSFRELVRLAVDSVGINHVQLGMVLDDLRLQIPETEAMFEKDLIDPAEEFTALEEARELLMTRGVEGFLREHEPQPRKTAAAVMLLNLDNREELVAALGREDAVRGHSGRAALVAARIEGLGELRASQGAETAARLLREAALAMLDNAGARVVGQCSDCELALWLADASADAAVLATRRIESAFTAALASLTGNRPIDVSLTLGVAMLEPETSHDIESLLDRATAALGHEPLKAGARVATATAPMR